MTTLQFTAQPNEGQTLWVTEFQVTADANLHIERPVGGEFKIYQRTGNGAYALVEGEHADYKKVIDADLTGIIYPKTIKIESSVEPTYAALTTSGEVTEIKSQSKVVEVTANGTTAVTPDAGYAYLSKVEVKVNVPQSGGGSTWRYFSTTYMYAPTRDALVSFAAALIRIDAQGIIAGGGALAALGLTSSSVNAVAVIPTAEIIMGGQTTVIEDFLNEAASDLVEITKEEFYNLNTPS